MGECELTKKKLVVALEQSIEAQFVDTDPMSVLTPGRIFLPPAHGTPLYVFVFIKAMEDAARTASAYTASLRAFGLGKERPMAPRILVCCSSGRGRCA